MKEPTMDVTSINNMVVNTPGARHAMKRYRERAIKKLGGKCVDCGFADVLALEIDHIHGNGAAERRQFGRAAPLVICKKIIHGSADYQLLCANCNRIKARVKKEHKHKPPKEVKGKSLYYDLNGFPHFRE